MEEFDYKMLFFYTYHSEHEARNYYASFARVQGFVVVTRSSKTHKDGRRRHITYCCHRGGKLRTKALKVKAHPTAKTGCQASMNISLHNDGKWVLNTIKLA